MKTVSASPTEKLERQPQYLQLTEKRAISGQKA
jgi:hypothetical protein